MPSSPAASGSGFFFARPLSFALGAVLALAMCREAPRRTGDDTRRSGDGGDAPALVALDSVVLQETDSLYLSLPSSFVLTNAGHVYVADVGQSQVVHFGPDGTPLGKVGRKGSGPGEYKAPTWLTLLGDSILLVKNDARLRVMAFDTDSGRFLWERVFPGLTSSMHVSGGHLYVGYIDLTNRGSIGVLAATPASRPSPRSDSLRVVGPFPELFGRVPRSTSVFGTVEVAAFRDTVVSAYEVSNHLYLTRLDPSGTGVIDSIDIPVVRRRGARTELFRQVTNDKNSALEVVYKSSIPFELARLSSGLWAYVAFDPTVAERRMTGKLFLSLIDPSRRKACVDVEIPAQTDPPARVTFRGDTLFTVTGVDRRRPFKVDHPVVPDRRAALSLGVVSAIRTAEADS